MVIASLLLSFRMEKTERQSRREDKKDFIKKYAMTNWNRKTIVRTYSKNRPCNVKKFASKCFDDVCEAKQLQGKKIELKIAKYSG